MSTIIISEKQKLEMKGFEEIIEEAKKLPQSTREKIAIFINGYMAGQQKPEEK